MEPGENASGRESTDRLDNEGLGRDWMDLLEDKELVRDLLDVGGGAKTLSGNVGAALSDRMGERFSLRGGDISE